MSRDWYVFGWESFEEPKTIGTYQLRPKDDAGNRYVLSKDILPKGSNVTIEDVFVARSFLLDRQKLIVSSDNQVELLELDPSYTQELCK